MAEKYEAERTRLLQENKRLRDQNKLLKSSGGSGASSKSSKPTSRRTNSAKPASVSAKAGKMVVRDLSLKQLKHHINAIFASKLAFDKKCKDAHLPRETMEQHMYTYLNQKYGLKSLIIEWASAVMAAVKKFSDEDNDVAVFGRILRNEIDEEFRIVQKQLKDTVAELLRVYLKGKHPLKSEDEVSKLLNKRIKSFVFEEEWTDIIKYMYNHEDSVNLIMKCKDYIEASQSQNRTQQSRGRGRMTREQESKER